MTSFLPGFDVDDEPLRDEAPPRPALPAPATPTTRRPDPPAVAPRFDAFAFRVRAFVAGLPSTRRREIALRPRFRNQPYLRLDADAEADDFLP